MIGTGLNELLVRSPGPGMRQAWGPGMRDLNGGDPACLPPESGACGLELPRERRPSHLGLHPRHVGMRFALRKSVRMALPFVRRRAGQARVSSEAIVDAASDR